MRDRTTKPDDGFATYDVSSGATGESATTQLLSVTGITKRFGGVEALAGCTLTIREGSITGLMGPNCVGKTTVLENVLVYAQSQPGEELARDGVDWRLITALCRFAPPRPSPQPARVE